MVRLRAMTITAAMATSCLLPEPVGFNNERPVTPPVILDLPGVTQPRLGNVVHKVVSSAGERTTHRFDVPIADLGLEDVNEFRFFVNKPRGLCVPGDGGRQDECDFEPGGRGFIPASEPLAVVRDQRIEAILEFPPTPPTGACHRVDLYVAGTRFTDYQQPRREGDIAFASWWVFIRREGGMAVDPTICNPVAP